MSQLLSPDTFEFFARYLLAGFVFLAARAKFIVGERPQPSEMIVEAVILSLINQFIFIMFSWPLQGSIASASSQILLFAEVLALPAVTGSLTGWLLENNLLPDGLRRLFMPVSRPVSKAYQHAFSVAQTPGFVLISFSDQREVYGYFGDRSLASPDGEFGGIYLESLYVISEEGTWIEALPPRSAWVSLQDARSIEFF